MAPDLIRFLVSNWLVIQQYHEEVALLLPWFPVPFRGEIVANRVTPSYRASIAFTSSEDHRQSCCHCYFSHPSAFNDVRAWSLKISLSLEIHSLTHTLRFPWSTGLTPRSLSLFDKFI